MSAGNRVQRIRRLALPTVLAALLLTGAVANAWAQFGMLGVCIRRAGNRFL